MTRSDPGEPSGAVDPLAPTRDESPWALAAARARAVPVDALPGGRGGDVDGVAKSAQARGVEGEPVDAARVDVARSDGTVAMSDVGTAGITEVRGAAAAAEFAGIDNVDPMPPARGPQVRRPTWRFMFAHPAHVLGLGFGSGLSRWAPGTMGTLLAWLLFRLLQPRLDDMAWGALIAASLIIGWWACTVTARHMGVADPGAVVWDEVVAFWIVLWLIGPTTLLGEACAFGLFRFFDAAKPGPVAWADALFKGKRGKPIGWAQGFGIIFDDLVAALCALLVIAIWRLW